MLSIWSVTYLVFIDGHLRRAEHFEVRVVGPKVIVVGWPIVLIPSDLIQNGEVLKVLLRIKPLIDLFDEG